jgi:hypothetical protein
MLDFCKFIFSLHFVVDLKNSSERKLHWCDFEAIFFVTKNVFYATAIESSKEQLPFGWSELSRVCEKEHLARNILIYIFQSALE